MRLPHRLVTIFLILLASATIAVPYSAYANDPSLVKARPKIPGDRVPDFKIEDLTGNTKFFRNLTNGKFVMVAFVPSILTLQENVKAYFLAIRPFIKNLGYEIIVVTTAQSAQARAQLYDLKNPDLYIDPDHSSFVAMGLADSNNDASAIPAIFLLSPEGKILSTFASSDPQIQFSGDSLVLAARIAKKYDPNAEKSLFRNGPTTAPRPHSQPMPLLDTLGPPPPSPNSNFALPDNSVLQLLTVDDLSHTNSLWIQGGLGVTAYDARRNAWSPRWSPGLQFGRRFNRLGIFLNTALDQTFDLTQEVKRLDVIHIGLGVESLAMYGRVRSSVSGGFAILNSDTDIDSRGKIGWYIDLRPISFRWRAAGPRGAFELTPLSLNISVPVTRGIPLILVGYMTMLTYEFATPVPQ